MIPRLVLRYHNSLVSRSITPGTKSIYWGTVVVWSMTIITLIKPFFIYTLSFVPQYPTNISYISSIVFYVVIPMEFLITSLIAVGSHRRKAVPIPAAQFTSNVLFCCCCCLCCCSSQSRTRGVQAMVLWGLMTFLYLIIMETGCSSNYFLCHFTTHIINHLDAYFCFILCNDVGILHFLTVPLQKEITFTSDPN